MDWSLYPNLYNFVKELPSTCIDINVEYDDVIQRPDYTFKENPVKNVERLELPTKKVTNIPGMNSNNRSLWGIVAGIIDEDHMIYPKAYQDDNVSCLIKKLKDFIVLPKVKSILTSPRMFKVLELLDKPNIEFTSKHASALGYFLSLLLESIIVIENNSYTHKLSKDNVIKLSRNSMGRWMME